jgi:citrate lyase beta subunit
MADKDFTDSLRSELLRRSVLFVPGDSLRKINKATELAADSLILDLEDGVAFNRKVEARRTVVEALGTLDFGRRERLVRLNPFSTLALVQLEGLPAEDLPITLEARPAGYVIPKVETPQHIRLVSDYLDRDEAKRGWPSNSTRLLAMIETARGVLNIGQIAQASQRLEALVFGAEDLANDLGARRTRAGWEVFYARSAVVTAAAAFGLQAIDMVFVDLNDLPGLEEECRFARQLGFAGKTTIHPRQIEVGVGQPFFQKRLARSRSSFVRLYLVLARHGAASAPGHLRLSKIKRLAPPSQNRSIGPPHPLQSAYFKLKLTRL